MKSAGGVSGCPSVGPGQFGATHGVGCLEYRGAGGAGLGQKSWVTQDAL